MDRLTHLSLFAGIGGIDLAGEAAGFRTVGQVEIADYARAVLEKHWPGVPRWRDVRAVTADALREAGIARPTLLSGGFPCQPYSCAGQRKGAADDRALWPEMLRVVAEIRPRWVLCENVPGFVPMALDGCAADLKRLGYTVRAFVIPAVAVGAPHIRSRCFVLARTDGALPHRGADAPALPRPLVGWADDREGEDALLDRLGIRRVSTGVPHRVQRLTCLGNAVVPQQVYPLVAAVAAEERLDGGSVTGAAARVFGSPRFSSPAASLAWGVTATAAGRAVHRLRAAVPRGVALWPTPNVPNGGRRVPRDAVLLGGATPTAYRPSGKKCQVGLEQAVLWWPHLAVPGQRVADIPAATGSLDPAFVEYLMGVPPGWTALSVDEMLASPRRRPPIR